MDKQNVYMQTMKYYSFSKRKNVDTCHNMEGLKDMLLSETGQSQKDKCSMIPPCIWGTWSSQVHRAGKQNAGWQGFGRMGPEYQFCKMERVLEINASNGCPVRSVFNNTDLCT